MSRPLKSKPDKFMKLVKNQDRPKTLGESCAVTNWDKHIQAEHNIKSYCRIQPTKDGKSRGALMTTPQVNEMFVAVKESMHGYFWIWILIIEQTTGRILYKFNSSEIQFVTWDEDEPELVDSDGVPTGPVE